MSGHRRLLRRGSPDTRHLPGDGDEDGTWTQIGAAVAGHSLRRGGSCSSGGGQTAEAQLKSSFHGQGLAPAVALLPSPVTGGKKGTACGCPVPKLALRANPPGGVDALRAPAPTGNPCEGSRKKRWEPLRLDAFAR